MTHVHHIDDLEFDTNEMLVNSDMIPAQMEVVMTDDGAMEGYPYDPMEVYEYEYDYEPDQVFEQVDVEEESPNQVVDWKEEQKRKLDMHEILDALPREQQEAFCRLMRSRGYEIDASRAQQNQHYLGNYRPTKRRFRERSDGGLEYTETDNYDYPDENVSEDYINTSVGQEDVDTMVDFQKAKGGERKCSGCNMFLRRSVYYHHARMIREKGACNLFTPQRFPCPQCDCKLGTLEKLCAHLEQIHDAPTQIKTEIFASEEEFNNFRIDLEGRGGNFRMARGNKKNKKGIVQYFRCNRTQTLARNETFRLVDNPTEDEFDRNSRRDQFPRKSAGSKQVIRTENACTAFYNKAYLDNGRIEVRYCDHHLHDDEKLRLPHRVRMRVLELARKQLPHAVILMIVKDEREMYCEKDSANDRRILEMRTQDIRQILSGISRQERMKMRKADRQTQRMHVIEKEGGVIVTTSEMADSTTRVRYSLPHTMRCNRYDLTPLERRYLDLFDNNRELVLSNIHERSRTENQKRTLYDSFLTKITAAHDTFKHVLGQELAPTNELISRSHMIIDLAHKLLYTIQNAHKEPKNTPSQMSFLKMMEQRCYKMMDRRQNHHQQQHHDEHHDGEVIDVVGVDEMMEMEMFQFDDNLAPAQEIRQEKTENEKQVKEDRDEDENDDEARCRDGRQDGEDELEIDMRCDEVLDGIEDDDEAAAAAPCSSTSRPIGGDEKSGESNEFPTVEIKEENGNGRKRARRRTTTADGGGGEAKKPRRSSNKFVEVDVEQVEKSPPRAQAEKITTRTGRVVKSRTIFE
ncbi:unnamed protein product [Caenorhabditis bovis]|uniref:C2H2-type domain-containing protein n=1 Tax=Caenorhabditis bovis TaxID=2654633 RepID=A0A8S1F438_9PELO|nr:unnamed protein product [Caenorhabditis bovis]